MKERGFADFAKTENAYRAAAGDIVADFGEHALTAAEAVPVGGHDFEPGGLGEPNCQTSPVLLGAEPGQFEIALISCKRESAIPKLGGGGRVVTNGLRQRGWALGVSHPVVGPTEVEQDAFFAR